MDGIDVAQRTGSDRETTWRARVAGEQADRDERVRRIAAMARIEKRKRQHAASRSRHRDTTRIRFRRWVEMNRERHNERSYDWRVRNVFYRTAFERIKYRLTVKGVEWNEAARQRCRRIALRISGG